MSTARRRIALLAVLALCAIPATALSQEWRASARVGRVTYEGTPAGASATSSVVLGLGRSGLRDWFGASAALPLGEDPFWAVLGGWKRLETQGAAGLLLDLSAHGFIQRHTAATRTPAPGPLPLTPQPSALDEPDLSGEGAGAELMAGGFAGSPSLRVESRAGVVAQRSSLGGVVQERALPNGAARFSLILSPPLTVHAETRGWLHQGGTHAHAGGTLQYVRGPLQLWGSLGRWVAGGLDGVTWSAGASTAVGPQVDLQLGGRGNAFDPVYLSSTETSFWAGLSLRVGSSRAVRSPVAEHGSDGRAVIRIAARSAKGTPSIAGDFTGWKPVPMQRQGSHWKYNAKIAPGVYHYAFVSEDGTWFVPESVPGRQADGMGGHVAVLVVS